MKTIQMFALTAGLSLATSMLAGATAKAPETDSARKSGAATTFHGNSKSTVLIARGEREPGDDHGRRGRNDRRRHDDGKGHRFNPLMARGEPQPGDDKGKGGKDDGIGHRFAPLMARGEPQPGDDKGKGGKDDGSGHRFAPLMARGEPQPGDDKGKGGKDDGIGHRAV